VPELALPDAPELELDRPDALELEEPPFLESDRPDELDEPGLAGLGPNGAAGPAPSGPMSRAAQSIPAQGSESEEAARAGSVVPTPVRAVIAIAADQPTTCGVLMQLSPDAIDDPRAGIADCTPLPGTLRETVVAGRKRYSRHMPTAARN
jgi:hypothetical protein